MSPWLTVLALCAPQAGSPPAPMQTAQDHWVEEDRVVATEPGAAEQAARDAALGHPRPPWPPGAEWRPAGGNLGRHLTAAFMSALILAGTATAVTVGVAVLPPVLAGVWWAAGPPPRPLWSLGGVALVAAAAALTLTMAGAACAFLMGEWTAIWLADHHGAEPAVTGAPRRAQVGRGQARAVVRAVISGAWRREAWRDALPVIGPALSLRASTAHLEAQAAAARRLSGLPRTYDQLHRLTVRWLTVRALVLSLAWLAAPLVPLAVAGAGVLTFAHARHPSAPDAVVAAVVGSLLTLAVAGAFLAVAAAGAGVLLTLLTPWRLAAEAVADERQPTRPG